jgi:hypothetical protein
MAILADPPALRTPSFLGDCPETRVLSISIVGDRSSVGQASTLDRNPSRPFDRCGKRPRERLSGHSSLPTCARIALRAPETRAFPSSMPARRQQILARRAPRGILRPLSGVLRLLFGVQSGAVTATPWRRTCGTGAVTAKPWRRPSGSGAVTAKPRRRPSGSGAATATPWRRTYGTSLSSHPKAKNARPRRPNGPRLLPKRHFDREKWLRRARGRVGASRRCSGRLRGASTQDCTVGPKALGVRKPAPTPAAELRACEHRLSRLRRCAGPAKAGSRAWYALSARRRRRPCT